MEAGRWSRGGREILFSKNKQNWLTSKIPLRSVKLIKCHSRQLLHFPCMHIRESKLNEKTLVTEGNFSSVSRKRFHSCNHGQNILAQNTISIKISISLENFLIYYVLKHNSAIILDALLLIFTHTKLPFFTCAWKTL